MKNFRDLQVWQKAHELTLQVYRLTGKFPSHELYGLVSQVRRACVSIPAKLAEGCCRQGDREFARFVQIAMASASEAEYLLLLSGDLGYITASERETLLANVEEVKRMLASLLSKLNTAH
ncbi:MAG: four helix bundle protein [Phycisphaerae bacterium]|nr:four helix bundle protein [Phycisphaerae bacterium]